MKIYEKVKNMRLDELAYEIYAHISIEWFFCIICPAKDICDIDTGIHKENCIEKITEWLLMDVEQKDTVN